jgi:hypothetical protein
MPKPRTEVEQRAYETRMKQLKQLLEHEISQQERVLALSEEQKDGRLSKQDLKLLKRIVQFDR